MDPNTDSLGDQAYGLLEQMIVTLQLSPGEVVSESQLSRQTDIGRTPLREALQRLADDRLVEILPRRGIRISRIDLRDHLALLETRRVLDRLLAERAAAHATDADRDALEARTVAMQESARDEDLNEFMRLDHEFDEIVIRAAKNPFAADAARPLHAHCRRFWYKFRAEGDLKQSARRHEELMRAIAAEASEEAADASDALIDYLQTFTYSTLSLG